MKNVQDQSQMIIQIEIVSVIPSCDGLLRGGLLALSKYQAYNDQVIGEQE